MKILFIRHGETDVNASGVLHKAHDPEGLNENGRKQASALGEACMRAGVEVIYTSPEARAAETAQIIGAIIDLQPVTIDDFRERDPGQWSGKTWSEIRPILDKMDFNERYTFRPPGGESWREAELRLTRSLDRIIHSENSTVSIVTHMGAIRILMPVLKNEHQATSYKYKYDFANGSITTFEYSDGKFRVLGENDTSHLA